MDEFEKMLKKARKERGEKASQRMVLDHEIAALDKTIEGLTMLCELPPDELPVVSAFAQEMLKYAGLTDVVRMCLQASPVPLTAAEIVAKLKDASYPTKTLENPRAAVNTILNRLLTSGEVQRKERGGDVVYSWIRGMAPRTRDFGQKRGEGERASLAPIARPSADRPRGLLDIIAGPDKKK